MKNIFHEVLKYKHNVDIATPIIENFDHNITLLDNNDYIGSFVIKNDSRGDMVIALESVFGLIKFEQSLCFGNNITINYRLNKEQLEWVDKDNIIITYNGGEIVLPVSVVIKKNNVVSETVISKVQEVKAPFIIYTNKRSYHAQDHGLFYVKNLAKQPMIMKFNYNNDLLYFQDQVEVLEDRVIPFEINVSRRNIIFGRIPLRTNPRVKTVIHCEIILGDEKIVKDIDLYITKLNDLETDIKIDTYKAYLLAQSTFYRTYENSLLVEGKINYTALLRQIKPIVNYDCANVVNRLIYVYLCIKSEKINEAIEQIKHINNYSLYFDKQGMNIDEVLACFISLINGEDIKDLVNAWEVKHQVLWWELILKNSVLKNYTNLYNDFKLLNEQGVNNGITKAEVIYYLNHNPFIPNTHDEYYKDVLLWGSKRGYLHSKLIKYLENNSVRLTTNNNIDYVVAKKIYNDLNTKNSLKLYCLSLMNQNNYSLEALIIYEKALSAKLVIKALTLYYIRSCYQCKSVIQLEYIHFITNQEKLESEAYRYLLYHVLVKRNQCKALYRYYKKDIEKLIIREDEFVEYPFPSNKNEISCFINHVIENDNFGIMTYCLKDDQNEKIGDEDRLRLIAALSKSNTKCTFCLSYKEFLRGNVNIDSLSILKDGFIGSLNQLMQLQKAMKTFNYFDKQLIYRIIYKSIFMNAVDKDIIQLYIDNRILFYEDKAHESILEKISCEVLLDDMPVNDNFIEVLEKCIKEKENRVIELALLKLYLKFKILDNKVESLLLKYINEDTILPWFKDLEKVLSLEIIQRSEYYFEYLGDENSQVEFIYRIDDETEFHRSMMKHITHGIYVAHVIMFYNERIQYYIKEYKEALESKEMIDIALSDIYCHEIVEESITEGDKYDIINTILIAKEMYDEESIDYEIRRYFEQLKIENEDMKLL